MATNITQKDLTLTALITHLDALADRYDRACRQADPASRDARVHLAGQIVTITDVKDWALQHLGYSGSTPIEAPNRSEEAAR
ncbi:hypothetical protein [Bifidobacterium cuniculi]|uniref:Uncharacterized protein n=1 Tax=Bifidobacterium cuniculi TaxID=1688 RepID=A0A087B4G5_9BIFI|nr:hypothetical protein [Bifidobacterium cuniculi]KFI65915.1 hypothetical protein BCUN_0414 [Bifidobacterium cuniculi]